MAQQISVARLRGITTQQVDKLKAHKITNSGHLLQHAGTTAGRKDLAGKSGIPESAVLELVNRADLARVVGIGRQYSNLLEDAGVDSVPELAQRNAANLHSTLQGAATKSGVQRPPSLKQVQDWVKQANALPRAVFH